MGIIVKH